MKLKNGYFIVEIPSGTPIVLRNRYDTASVLSSHYGSTIVGYQRTTHYPVSSPDFFFMTDHGQPERFDNIADAETYVYERGWDDDNTTTLGNYFPILSRLKASIPCQPLEYIAVSISFPLKCDCGGAKCKLPCMEWCSTRRINDENR